MTAPPGEDRIEAAALVVRPVTAELWPQLEAFFGPSGAYSNCWCTWWRQTSPEFTDGCRDGGAGNRKLLHRITADGQVPGLLGYDGDDPVGWVSVAPRDEFGRLLRSRNLKPEPDEPGEGVWAVVCFWIPRQHRRRGVGTALLNAAADHARDRGATVLEAYPIDTRGQRAESASLFTGTLGMFTAAGFQEIRRRSDKRPVVRRDL